MSLAASEGCGICGEPIRRVDDTTGPGRTGYRHQRPGPDRVHFAVPGGNVSLDDTEALELLLQAAGIPEGTREEEALATVRAHSEAAGDLARLCDALREYHRRATAGRPGHLILLAEVLDGHGIEIAGINAPDSPEETP